MIRLALFDCDGTLVDSQANICAAMTRCFTDQGLVPPKRNAILRVVGLSLPDIMRVLLPDEDDALHRHLVAQYRLAFQALRAEGMVAEPLYDGIVETIDALAAKGWLLGVATGKSDRGLAHCLAQHRLADRFVTLQTADRHPSKPHPAMIEAALGQSGAAREATVMIGDTQFDMAMARAANVRAIGVGWGYHMVADLWAAGADAVALHPRELLPIMERV